MSFKVGDIVKFDKWMGTGNWSKPYRDNVYTITCTFNDKTFDTDGIPTHLVLIPEWFSLVVQRTPKGNLI